jgi:pimeloyl-ACP methyl ester carboxylesterase
MTTMIGAHPVITGRWPIDPALPTLIFVHGAALSKGLWQYQVADLSDAANTIALDLPGHGASIGKGYDDVAGYADAVIDLMGHVPCKETVLCGLSMGGAIALEILIRRPDAAVAAVLMNTGARLKVLPLIFETIEKDFQQYLELSAQFCLGPDCDRNRIIPLLSAMTTSAAEVAFGDFCACNAFDVMNELDRIQAPVLVITGEKDMITPPKYGQFLHANIAGSRMVSVPGAGHLSPIEQKQSVSSAIREFLFVRQWV